MSEPRLPTIGQIVGVLSSPAVQPEPILRPDAASDVLGPIVALHHSNTRQWEREDDARRGDSDDRVVAAAKRDIDRLNGARHGFIEDIDRAISPLLPPCERAPLVTESPGMAIDRLSVLLIRIASTEARAASGAPDAGRYAERLPRLRSQLDALGQAIAVLLDDLAEGRRRCIPYQGLKLYGEGRSRTS